MNVPFLPLAKSAFRLFRSIRMFILFCPTTSPRLFLYATRRPFISCAKGYGGIYWLLTGAIICGTGQQSGLMVTGGKLLAKMEVNKNGARFKSEKLNQIAFGSYNKGFAEHRTDFDWLSRDSANVDKYIADPLCGFVASAGLFFDMMTGIQFIGSAKNIAKMNKALPVFFIAGDKDPVGENGKGVVKVYHLFLNAGMSDVTMKLYPDCRHELLNELNKDEVMLDVLNWLVSKLPKAAE